MAEQTSRNKVNIGLSSLILIFIVLCLSTFGLLELAERGAQAAKEFYEADSKGQQWLAGSDRMLQQMAGRSLEEKLEALAAKPGNGYDEQTGLIFTEIPMERGESLHIDLELKEGDKRYEIRSWYVYDSGEYEIDDTVKVWDGKDRSGT